uniref:MYND-type domain-containing protein n=1 Tax=Heterorhabditis bacteriophora TaxID=37862 RepID=A0A1I7XK68_HETBA
MVTVAEECPFAAVVDDGLLSSICSYCFSWSLEMDQPLKRCIKCKVMHYCGAECQKNDLLDHKNECTRLAATGCMSVPPRPVRLISRMIIKLARESSLSEKSRAFNGRTVGDMIDNSQFIEKDPDQIAIIENISKAISLFLEKELIPQPAALISIYGMYITNSFAIYDRNHLRKIGAGLYVGLSIHEHSCTPDAYIVYDGRKALMRTANVDVTYNTELTVSYIHMMQTTPKRRQQLKKQYYFDCMCNGCCNRGRDMLARSVRSTCCTDGICMFDPSDTELICNKCGGKSKMSVEKAVALNTEMERKIDIMDEKLKKLSAEVEIVDILSEALRTYNRFAKVLSPMNMALALYAKYFLFYEPMNRGLFPFGKRYAHLTVPVHRRYLPNGCPELAMFLLDVHVARLDEQQHDVDFNLMNEVRIQRCCWIGHSPCLISVVSN